MKKPLILMFLAFVLTFSGCSSVKKNVKTGQLVKIAVLAFSNQSNDTNGPVVLRNTFDDAIRSRGYATVPTEKIDEILRDMGVTDGGQLNSFDPKQLAEKIGTNYLIYGDVIQYFHGAAVDLFPPGLVNKTEVKAGFKLVNASDGKVIWHKEKYGIRKDRIKKENDIVKDIIKNTVKSQLETVSRGVVMRAIDDFPNVYVE